VKLLAIYYLVQGLLLIAVGVGGLVLVDQNQLLAVKEWLHIIRLDPENRFIHGLLTTILPVTNEMLEASSIGFFLYVGYLLGSAWRARGAEKNEPASR